MFNSSIDTSVINHAVAAHSLQQKIFNSAENALEQYLEIAPDWIVFGNNFKHINNLKDTTKTAMLYHGIGIKDCYYEAKLSEMDVRFVEGPYRKSEIHKRTPKANIIATGFAKLDSAFYSEDNFQPPDNFDKNKKTLLYAPTFYPSTIENIPDHWPKDFSKYNIIVKPHEFSMTNHKYNKQRIRIEQWNKFENVYLADKKEFSLLPFMKFSDILISEASSALFEFAALNKPVIWCDFIKLRWSYRGVFSYRLKKRMDMSIMKYSHIAAHAPNYKNLLKVVEGELNNPNSHASSRITITDEVIGSIDGRAAQRICNYLLDNIIK